MDIRGVAVSGINLVLLAGLCGGLRAQTTAAPTAYTVTANNSIPGGRGVTKTYRLGAKALVDQSGTPAEVTGSSHTVYMRTLYDLDKKESLTWDPVNNSATCVKGSFSGDWGDPFGGAAELVKQGARQVGTQTIQGFATRILETPAGPKGVTRAWVDNLTGLVVKVERTPPGESPQTVMEVTNVSLSAPAASEFVVPSSCAEVAGVAQAPSAGPQPATDAIAAFTGVNGKNFVNGMVGPGSKNSCNMTFRVVHAGTMEPIAGPFQVAVDLKVATEPSPHYTIGTSEDGKATFSGGALHEIAAQGRDGGFRIDNIPAQFEMDVEFGSAGSAAASIYRQCFAPQTPLLYVVKDPANIAAGGAWLWVKTGKSATVPR